MEITSCMIFVAVWIDMRLEREFYNRRLALHFLSLSLSFSVCS